MRRISTLTGICVLVLLFVITDLAQEIKPPYILGQNNMRIKSKNFLAGKKPTYGKTYRIYNNPKGASITFDKGTNEFEIVTGAENTTKSINAGKQEIRKAETILLRITGIAPTDKCRINILVRLIVLNTTDGGRAYQYLPSCGAF